VSADISRGEAAEENSVRFGLLTDAGLFAMIVVVGLLGGSLTMVAESIRATLMNLIEVFAFVVMCRINRGQLAELEYGSGKLEQVANALIGAGMLGGAIWITGRGLAMMASERAGGPPLGLALAAVAGAINLYFNFVAWNRVRAALRVDSSIVMLGQFRARRVKFLSSLFVQATLTIAALSTDEEVVAWADAIGALFVAIVLVVNGIDMLSSGVGDLLDRSAGTGVRQAVDRALVSHAGAFSELVGVRSRRSGRMVFIELGLRFDPALSLAEVDRRIEGVKESICREIDYCDISILASAGGS
jgi:divalent metal cation (Fe/Co/Zn/Cd) transporter